MLIKPLNYYAASKHFLAKNWARGKALVSEFDGIVRSGMEVYRNVAPVIHEAARLYGGSEALQNVDRNVQKAAGLIAATARGRSRPAKLPSAWALPSVDIKDIK